MSDKFIRARRTAEISPFGMKTVELEGNEIVIGNCGEKYYAIQRRCGHMNAPLEMGTLDSIYLTCPMHFAQFDITTGEAISGPVSSDTGHESLPPILGEYMQHIGMLMGHVRMKSIRIYPTKIESGWVLIGL